MPHTLIMSRQKDKEISLKITELCLNKVDEGLFINVHSRKQWNDPATFYGKKDWMTLLVHETHFTLYKVMCAGAYKNLKIVFLLDLMPWNF